jgi:DNA-binding SARP family transcriptional activator
LIRARRFDLADAALKREPGEVAGSIDEMRSLLLTAHIQLRTGKRQEGLERLGHALSLGKEAAKCSGILPQAPDILASLCAEALEAGIEPCYARRLIDQAGLFPPSPNLSNWPYPVRIHTLGQWAVVVKGQPLRFSGKAQRRPLLLLQSLLARRGRAVPVAMLRKAMGEDEAGGDSRYSRGAFDMALSRLRRLLGVPDLLRLGDGLLSLNEDLCWVDAWACERLLGQVEQQPDPVCGSILLDRALRFHEGDFLAGEETAWAVLARERLRSRLLRVTRSLGRALEEAGHWAEAGELYERLREYFPLDEELCLHLIRSHIRRNQFAQATSMYARCRELLARVLGVLPNPAIKALFEPASL